ncbi:MAG: hypothetical protein WB500_07040, partial [Rhodoplanes sp.]
AEALRLWQHPRYRGSFSNCMPPPGWDTFLDLTSDQTCSIINNLRSLGCLAYGRLMNEGQV